MDTFSIGKTRLQVLALQKLKKTTCRIILRIILLRYFLLGQWWTQYSGVRSETIWIFIVDHICLYFFFFIFLSLG